jgi:hypothetical protein
MRTAEGLQHRSVDGLPACPSPGSGVHCQWMMQAAWACRKAGMSAQDACDVLHGRITRRPNPPDEIEIAVEKVFSTKNILVSRAYGPGPGKWPPPNSKRIEAIASTGFGAADLWEESPVRLDCPHPHTSLLLEALFPGNPQLCHGSRTRFRTAHLSEFASYAHTLEQIVPSPMLAKYGWTKSGKLSEHSLEATGPRKFIVVEGDKIGGEPIPKDTQAAVLLHLGELAPLALVVDSAGKSLHGWFHCEGVDERKLRNFFAYAITLGADAGMWTRSQFVRMPDGRRDNEKMQNILYFNPEAIT